MKVITDIFGLILKFRSQLVSQSWRKTRHDNVGSDITVEHPGFEDMRKTFESFKEYSVFLFRGE